MYSRMCLSVLILGCYASTHAASLASSGFASTTLNGIATPGNCQNTTNNASENETICSAMQPRLSVSTVADAKYADLNAFVSTSNSAAGGSAFGEATADATDTLNFTGVPNRTMVSLVYDVLVTSPFNDGSSYVQVNFGGGVTPKYKTDTGGKFIMYSFSSGGFENGR
jgi:hypothetical protein